VLRGCSTFITREPHQGKASRAALPLLSIKRRSERHQPVPQKSRRSGRLIHFQNARRFHDRRPLLAVREMLGAFAVDVHAREFLPVTVEYSNLPVPVFAPFVLANFATSLTSSLCHDWFPLVYVNMAILARLRK